MKEDDIKVGATYIHPSKIRYRVDEILDDVTYWEKNKINTKYVFYSQLDSATFPSGKKWIRKLDNFLEIFKKE